MYQKKAPCTIVIIVMNVAVFLGLSFIGMTEDAEFMLDHGAMYVPSLFINHEYYRFFTSMFLHFSMEHLMNNMLMLGLIGWQLELEIGKIKYLIIYFMSGLGGTALSVGKDIQVGEFAVSAGASGAIFGLIGAILYVALRNKGKMNRITPKGILFMIFLSLYYGFTSTGVDNMAHIGGLVTGFLLALLLYRKRNGNRSSGI